MVNILLLEEETRNYTSGIFPISPLSLEISKLVAKLTKLPSTLNCNGLPPELKTESEYGI